MRCVLATVGTDGDVNPYLGIGRELASRGHSVCLMTHANYEDRAREFGFEFEPLYSREETDRMLGNPDIWHPVKSAKVAAGLSVEFIERQHKQMAARVEKDAPVVIASPGLLAVRVLRDQFDFPLIQLVLQPWLIPSDSAPPVMPFGVSMKGWWPPPAKWAYWRAIDHYAARVMGRQLNRLRSKLDLPPVKRIFRWWFSPDRVLAMFPDWFGQVQPDWPEQFTLCGFPMFDGVRDEQLPDDVCEFLEHYPQPVAVTFGTGMRHAEQIFTVTMAACQSAGLPAILLARHQDQLPRELPSSVLACPYAPFQALFPQCGTVVHHGGVGTTAKALRAGVPQIVVPFAYDQQDNAQRIKKLGVGEPLPRRKLTADRLAISLQRLRVDEIIQACSKVRDQFDTNCAIESAADQIEALGTKQASRSA